MRRSRNLTPLVMACIFVGIAAALLGLVALRQIAQELLGILMIVSGATFFSGLSLLLSFSRQPRSAPLIQITFNHRQLREELEHVIDAEFREIEPQGVAPWEPTAEKLMSEDSSLALAKVRIDIEREIRRLALETDTMRWDQRFDMHRTLATLEARKVLPSAAIAAIRDIIPICNRALHGEEIDATTARKVTDIAGEVMVILHSQKHYAPMKFGER